MPEEEGKVAPEKPWQKVEWGKDKIAGIGYEIEPINRGNKKAKWAFSLTLPQNADPSNVSIKYADSPYGPNRRHNDNFTVTYKVIGSQELKVIMVPLGSGDRRIDKNHFSVHTRAEIEKFTV